MSEPGIELPDEAPEADFLEQYQSPVDLDEEVDHSAVGSVPPEADPADVDEQRRAVGLDDEDEYR